LRAQRPKRNAVASYLYETLPTPVVGTFGQTVSLSDILAQEFGPNYGGYTDFYLSYYGADTLKQDNFKYWTDTPGSSSSADTVTTWLQSGFPIGPATQTYQSTPAGNNKVDIPGANVVHVTASNINQFSLQIGSNIAPVAFISVPVAFDSENNPTEFVQYSVSTVDPALYNPTPAPTPSDMVAEAYAFWSKYPNVDNNADCGGIAQDVAAGIGATFGDPVFSTDPAYNVSAGFWRIAYPDYNLSGGGTPNPHWSTLVQPGDIVRFGRTPTINNFGMQPPIDNGAHMFIVLATQPAGDGVHDLLTVYDNGDSGEIGVHYDWVPPALNASPNSIYAYYHYYDDEADPSEVTIYRLASDHKYLIDETQPGLGDNPNVGGRLLGTVNDDHIIGGNGDDTISSWIGNDLIDGGGGLNALDYSWDANPVSVDLWGGAASKGNGWTDQLVNIQSFIGGSVNDVFYGAATKSTFDGGKGINRLDYSSTNNFFHVTVDVAQHTVTKQILGYNGVDDFSNIERFVGTFADDIFRSTVSGSFTFDGDDGIENKLDYSSFQTGITVNLQQASGTVENRLEPIEGRLDSRQLLQHPGFYRRFRR
jgi:hypothetical protein